MKRTQSLFKTLLISGITLFPIINCFAQNWNETIKAVASDRGVGDYFGISVSISGNCAIVGASQEDEDLNGINTLNNAGAAYFFERDVSGNWVEVQKVVASDRGAGDSFGNSVSINGNYAIVGAIIEDEDLNGTNTMNNAGAAYFFERDESGNWVEVQKVVATDRNADDFFGSSVSINGDHAIIGAKQTDSDASGANALTYAGAAYIFKRNESGVWNEMQKIVASDRGSFNRFGNTVSIYGEYVIVGPYFESEDALGANSITNAGAAYIFERNEFGVWNEKQKIVASDRSEEAYFGRSVSIFGDQALIGAYGNNAAYIFKPNGSGEWNEMQRITSSDENGSDQFGCSVSISGIHAIIGAQYEDEDIIGTNTVLNSGSAYIFEKNNTGLWDEVQKVVASDRGDGDLYGSSVAISEKFAFVGVHYEDEDEMGLNSMTYAGSAYIIEMAAVSGQIYNDLNNNCITDDEVGIAGRLATISPGNIVVQTNSYGYWYTNSLPIGTYTITVDTSGIWDPTCPTVQIFDVINTNFSTIAPSFGFISTNPCPEPNVSINMPFLRPGFSNQKVYVQACNKYNASGTLDNTYVIVDLDTLLTVNGASISYTDFGNNSFRFDLGTLNPGQCEDFNISTTLSSSAILGQSLCMTANLFPADNCVFDTLPANPPTDFTPCDLPWDNSSISVDGWCQNDSVFFVITNTGDLGDGDMDCYSPVRLYIDGEYVLLDSIQLLGGLSDTLIFVGDGRTFRLEVDQHPLHPGNSNPNATIELCGNSSNWTSDLVNILPMDDADPIKDIYCGLVTGSYDPNDKKGYPLGVTDNHFITPNGQIEYMIRFQNTGTDTAFTVVVTDTLDTDLDIFSVRSGASSHNYSFRIFGQRILEWTFNNIMLPDSNVNEPASNGFITFKVDQNNNLIDNTEINNSANIYFDFNEPIITNTSNHVIQRNITNPTWVANKTIVATDCDEYIYNSYSYTNTGTYWQVENDTLVTLDVTILNSPPSTDVQTACDSYTWIDGNTYTSTSNSATFVYTNAAGCDSLVTLDLTISNSTSSSDVQTACDNYTWIDGITYTSTNNSATHILTNSAGCDSLVTLDLTINTISDLSTSTSGETITANNTDATYQWLNCDDNYAIIANETGESYTATVNGNYAVEITKNGCLDTTACVAITSAGIIENGFGEKLIVSPNPTDGNFSIDLGANYENAEVIIMDLSGRLIESKNFTHSQVLNLYLKEAAGVYLVSIQAGNKKAVIQLVKE